MALQKFTFHEGTTGNPVVLTQRHINGLVALSLDASVTKDIKGVVKSQSGKMFKSEYNAIAGLGFTIVDTEQISDNFTIYCANTGTVYEGGSVQVYSTGIPMEQLVLNVVMHEIIIQSGAISEEVIKNRIHIENGLVMVDAAEENASWQDTITIQAYPKYDPTNKVLINAPINIQAISLSGISLTVAKSVLIGKKTTVEVENVPTNATKPNNRVELSCTHGALGNGIYLAPDTPCEDTIVAECYLFGGSLPTFRVEKTISVKQPTIICQIADKDGSEVEGAYIVVTDGVTGVETQLNNGDSMVAVMGRTYSVTANLPTGYTKVVVVGSVTPKEVETIISAVYYPIQVGIMAVYGDGSYVAYDEWVDSGMPATNADGAALIGAGYQSADGESYFVADNEVSKKWSNTNVDIAATQPDPNNNDGSLLVTQERAKKNTTMIASVMGGQGDTAETCAAIYCQSMTKTIGGEERQGWLPSCKQLKALANNVTALNTVRGVAGLATIYPNSNSWWSCCQSNASNAWTLTNGNPYNYNTSKSNSNRVVPFYDL